jgi:N-acyl-D-aspartate/D-glutamate deacylase
MDMLNASYEAKWNCRSLCQEDVDRFMRYPATMIGSDGSSLSTEGPLAKGNPHPRNFGAFPRVLNEYVRQRGVLMVGGAWVIRDGTFTGKLPGLLARKP